MEVYHTPKSRVSLLSASKVMKGGWKISMDDGRVEMVKGKERLTMQKQGSLWSTSLGTTNPTIHLTTSGQSSSSPLEEEHQRLGHVGVPVLMELAKKGLLRKGYDHYKNDTFRMASCPTCQQSKMTRESKKEDSPLLDVKGEGLCLDVDLAGPFERSIDGYEYLFVGVERSSGIVISEPIEDKSKGFDTMVKWAKKIERQIGERVRIIRSDGGGEFGGKRANQWYEDTGCQHYITPRYTPELNGACERMVRTLKSMVSSMLLDTGVCHHYWSYAARYASVILMKTSSKGAWTRLTC